MASEYRNLQGEKEKQMELALHYLQHKKLK